MTITQLRENVVRLYRPEDGSALTEFTMFLPVWVVMLIAVTSLARIGVFSTQVQLQAQRELWTAAVNVDNIHVSPVTGYGHSIGEYGRLAGADNNPQYVNDGLEVVSSTAAELRRHYVESYDRSVLPPTQMFHQDGLDATSDPKEVLQMDDTARYPHRLLNDTIEGVSTDGGLIGFIATAASLAGVIHYSAAGIRYGSVFGDAEDSTTLMGTWGTLQTGFHVDTLVSPRPLTGTEASTIPALWAFALFKTDEKYEKYLQWGNENWGGNSGDGSEFEYDGGTDEDSLRDQHEDGADDRGEECEEQRNDLQDQAQQDWEDAGNEGSAPPVDFDFTACAAG